MLRWHNSKTRVPLVTVKFANNELHGTVNICSKKHYRSTTLHVSKISYRDQKSCKLCSLKQLIRYIRDGNNRV